MCKYNFLALELIEVKLYVKMEVFDCIINAHTAFLLYQIHLDGNVPKIMKNYYVKIIFAEQIGE